jgi:hypothetical protein
MNDFFGFAEIPFVGGSEVSRENQIGEGYWGDGVMG